MLSALAEFEIDCVQTTAIFDEAVLRNPIFREGTMNTTQDAKSTIQTIQPTPDEALDAVAH
jgi:hypothetical protein